MKKLIISGYMNRNDGPSYFTQKLAKGLSDYFDISVVQSNLNWRTFVHSMCSDYYILNSQNMMPLILLIISLFSKKKKIVSVIHGEMGLGKSRGYKYYLLKLTQSLMLKLSDVVVFVSNRQRDEFLKIGKRELFRSKSKVIYNGINFDEFIFNETKPKNKQIVYVGGEKPDKGACILDDVIDILANNVSLFGYELLLYGMNDEKTYQQGNLLVSKIKKVSHNEIVGIYKKTEIFLSLSVYETFGIAAVEAYVANNKVVAFNKCGFTEVLGQSNVFLVSDYTAAAFAEAVVTAIKAHCIPNTIQIEKLSDRGMLDRYLELLE